MENAEGIRSFLDSKKLPSDILLSRLPEEGDISDIVDSGTIDDTEELTFDRIALPSQTIVPTNIVERSPTKKSDTTDSSTSDSGVREQLDQIEMAIEENSRVLSELENSLKQISNENDGVPDQNFSKVEGEKRSENDSFSTPVNVGKMPMTETDFIKNKISEVSENQKILVQKRQELLQTNVQNSITTNSQTENTDNIFTDINNSSNQTVNLDQAVQDLNQQTNFNNQQIETSNPFTNIANVGPTEFLNQQETNNISSPSLPNSTDTTNILAPSEYNTFNTENLVTAEQSQAENKEQADLLAPVTENEDVISVPESAPLVESMANVDQNEAPISAPNMVNESLDSSVVSIEETEAGTLPEPSNPYNESITKIVGILGGISDGIGKLNAGLTGNFSNIIKSLEGVKTTVNNNITQTGGGAGQGAVNSRGGSGEAIPDYTGDSPYPGDLPPGTRLGGSNLVSGLV